MSSRTGGTATAAGLEYQYRAALDTVLTRLEKDASAFVFVTEGYEQDVIDYGIKNADGEYELVAQAKGAVEPSQAKKLSPGELWDIVLKLIAVDAVEYQLRTCRPLSDGAGTLAARLVTAKGAADVVEELKRSDDQVAGLSALKPQEWERIRRVTVDTDDPDERQLRDRIRTYRADLGLGLGEESSRVCLMYLMGELLTRSAEVNGHELGRDELNSLLTPAGREMALATGAYDWGIIVGDPPPEEPVARVDAEAALAEYLYGLPTDRRLRRAAITGMSGAGKSVLAARFAYGHLNKYDRILWLDASSEATVTAAVDKLWPSREKSETAREFLRRCLNESPAFWLIVFDNAPSVASVDAWICEIAHADIVVTTINATDVSGWRSVHLDRMTDEEAIELVGHDMNVIGVMTDAQRAAARELIRLLDFWPLAIAIGCAFLSGSGRGLEFSGEYLADLKRRIEQEQNNVPERYRTRRSLWEVIAYALEQVASQGASTGRLTGWELLQAQACLPPERGLIDVARRVADHVAGRSDSSQNDIDGALFQLNTASLVQRLPPRLHEMAAIRVNAVVLDIVLLWMGSESVTRYALATHQVLEEELETATKDVDTVRLADIVPSCVHIVSDLVSRPERMFSPAIIAVICGNLGMYYTMQCEWNLSAQAYFSEIRLLESEGLTESGNWAAAQCGFAGALWSLNSPASAVIPPLEAALGSIETYERIDPKQRGDIADQLALLVDNMIRVDRSGDTTPLDSLSCRLKRIPRAQNAEWSTRRKIDQLLEDPSVTPEVVLTLADGLLADDLKAPVRLEALGQKAEALAHLKRYDESASTWADAVAFAQVSRLNLASSVSLMSNACLTAAVFGLASFDPVKGYVRQVVRLCEQISTVSRAERDRLDVCLLAAGVFDEPLAAMEPIENRLANPNALTADNSIKSNEPHRFVLEACRMFLDVRRACAGAPVFPIGDWGSAVDGESGQPEYLQLTVPAEAIRLAEHAASSGTWIVNPYGMGLAVGSPASVVLWLYAHEVGIVTESSEALPGSSEVRRAAVRLYARTCGPERTLWWSDVVLVEADDAAKSLRIGQVYAPPLQQLPSWAAQS